jgi:microcystin-dependent protein
VTSISTYPQAYMDSLPIGAMIPWPHDTVPAGYVAQASVISRLQYADLFALVGETWGDGDGSTTFSAPFGDPGTLPWNAPRGEVARAAVTANQSTITTEVDLTGLTVTFTQYPNRRYRYTFTGEVTDTAGNGAAVFKLTPAASTPQLKRWTYGITATAAHSVHLEWEETAASFGSVTRKMRAFKAGGSGSLALNDASATNPSQLIVEDLGADLTQDPYSVGQWIVKALATPAQPAGSPYEISTDLVTAGLYEGQKRWNPTTSREWTWMGGEWRLTGGRVPFVRAYKASGTQAVTQHIFTTPTLNGEVEDTDGFHDNGSNPERCTVPIGSGLAGRYRIDGRVELNIASGGTIAINLRYNGSASLASEAMLPRADGGGSALACGTVATLAEGDYVEVQGYQNGLASGVNYGTGTSVTYLEMTYLGPE